MHELRVLRVELTLADGRRRELVVDSELVRIGSGAHCEVRLPAEDAAAEQLEVRVSASGLWGRVRNLDRPTLLDGVRFIEGPLSKDAIVEIGAARVALHSSTAKLFDAGKNDREKAGNRVIHGLALIGFPLGFWLLLGVRAAEPELPELVEPPPLFAAAPEPCKVAEPEAAAAFAVRELARAQAERERAPFDGGSGVSAVQSFERAAACFGAAHEGARAERTRAVAAELRRDVEKEFHVHHVRLERALATEHYDVARREIALLVRFMGKRSGEYREWLLALDRNLELKFSGRMQS